MRKEKSGNRYFGFNELATQAFNLPVYNPDAWDGNDEKKKEVQSNFEKRHTCRSCNTPLTYKGSNVMTCENPECNKQGNFVLLNSGAKKIAIKLYGENENKGVKA